MTSRSTLAVGLTLLLSTMSTALARPSQTPVFRSRTDVVLVTVSVTRGGVPVQGLTADDFEVIDNGVRQSVQGVTADGSGVVRQGVRESVTSVDEARVPVDVSLLVDDSKSVLSDVEGFKADIERFTALLRPVDRVRVVSFSSVAHEVVAMQAPGALDLGGLTGKGSSTSLNDGLLYALLWPEEPDRRNLIIVFTDGYDTSSTLGSRDVPELGQHTSAVVHAVLTDERHDLLADLQGASRAALLDVVALTGGQVHAPKRAFDDFRQILESFHASYLLRFQPTGTPEPGWHDLTVRLVGPKAADAEVRARRGYFVR